MKKAPRFSGRRRRAFLLPLAAALCLLLLFAGCAQRDRQSVRFDFTEEVGRAAEKYGVEEARIYAVIRVESDFRPTVVSPHGAVGLMQMLPSTFEEQCALRGESYDPERLKDPWVNVDYCTEYLKILFDMTGSWDWAHIGYFAGIGNVQRWAEQGLSPQDVPMESARSYLKRVNEAYGAYTTALSQLKAQGKTP